MKKLLAQSLRVVGYYVVRAIAIAIAILIILSLL